MSLLSLFKSLGMRRCYKMELLKMTLLGKEQIGPELETASKFFMKEFTYKFNEGPLSSIEELLSDWSFGNCRRVVQYYTFLKKKIFLKPEEVLCPEAYYRTGIFVIKEGQEFSTSKLLDGDIIYAEKIRDKEEKVIDKSLLTFPAKDDYIVSLHTAIFTREKNKEIWHATAIEGSSCFWPLEKFINYYRPIVVKRI